MEARKYPKRLVFVLGFPRSGTTWVSNLINSHPNVVYRHELIGRAYESFGRRLFEKMKYEDHLTDDEYAAALSVCRFADPVADRPPFFRKNYFRFGNVAARKVLWGAASKVRMLSRVYGRLYTPTDWREIVLVIKETRAAANLEQILSGLRADAVIVLIRSPFAVVASHVSGIRKGVMRGFDRKRRADWYTTYKEHNYLVSLKMDHDHIAGLSDVEFLAVNWAVQNSDYFSLIRRGKLSAALYSYENFLNSPADATTKMLEFIGIGKDKQVEKFISASTSMAKKSVFKVDAGNQFFSVFRRPSFDRHKWRHVLSANDMACINRHYERIALANSDLLSSVALDDEI